MSDPLASYYDDQLEVESVDMIDLLAVKAPPDNLCSAISPDGAIISITGSNEQYTSPENVFFVLLSAFSQDKNNTIKNVLDKLNLDLVYTA